MGANERKISFAKNDLRWRDFRYFDGEIFGLIDKENHEVIFQVSSMSGKLSKNVLEKCFKFQLINSMGKVVTEYGTRINTLEKLMEFKAITGHSIILCTSPIDGKTPCIQIYD